MAIAAIDVLARELALFACVGFLIGGIDDLALDIVYLFRDRGRVSPAAASDGSKRIAVFVPAWEEASVIGAMLANTLSRFDHADYRLYVGGYPNDPATLAAIGRVAARDDRVRLVINPRRGPTTKGDNLNAMWRALIRDEAGDGWVAEAVVLHDAEDVVSPAELKVFDGLLDTFALIQLPVVPLIVPGSRWISAHYADEFAVLHERSLTVRQMLGAGLPLAGVGCALRRDALDAIAAERGGNPFNATSLVEDYELGLAVGATGARGCFARATDAAGRLVCVRSYFPATLSGAVRQKARWMAGIALIGWDRLGWGQARQVGEHWMRMRDRRGLLAMLIIAAGYTAMALAAMAAALHYAATSAPLPTPRVVAALLGANSLLLMWRALTRAVATGRIYGLREGLRAIPRMAVGNFIALLAARRALAIYVATLRGGPAVWDKTVHLFPSRVEI